MAKQEISEEEKNICSQCDFSEYESVWCEGKRPFCHFTMWHKLDPFWSDFPKKDQIVLVLFEDYGSFGYMEAQYLGNREYSADSWKLWGNCPGDIIAWMDIPKCYKTHIMKDMELKAPIDKPNDVVLSYIRHDLHCPICGDVMTPIRDCHYEGLGIIPQNEPAFSDPKQHPHFCTKCRYIKLYGISHDYPYIEKVYTPVSHVDDNIIEETPENLPVDNK